MSDFNWNSYNTRKSSLTANYGASGAKQAYARFLAQQRGDRNIADITQSWQDKVPGFINSYTRRGLAGPGVSSGVYANALSKFDANRVRAISDATQARDGELGMMDLGAREAEAAYNGQMAELEGSKNDAISNSAATLLAFKPFLGG